MAMRTPLLRRTFLRGAGAAMSLPLLEGMIPQAGAAAKSTGTAAAPVRLGFVFFPNGANPDAWNPRESGRNWTLSRTLEPLGDLKSDVTVFSGLAQNNASSLGDGAGDHARSAATFLTSLHPVKTAGADIRAGRSIDQVVADAVGGHTRLASLELGTEGGRNAGSCDSGYSCAYSNSISWRSPSQPTSKEINPRLVFERLFGNGGVDADAAKKRLAYRRSILDMVSDDAANLQRSLGTADRQKLDEYFTTVREVEHRLEKMQTADPLKPPADFAMPSGIPADAREHIRLMYDLMAIAFETDSTRVSTFMLANEGSNRTYPMVDVKSGHHSLSHHRNEDDKVEQIRRIDRFLVEEFAYFLRKLKSKKEGESNLLDNSLILYGCAIGDGNRHNHDKLPILLAGSGRAVKPGQHIKYENDVPLSNLFLSMADAAGSKVREFGDSTGMIKGLS